MSFPESNSLHNALQQIRIPLQQFTLQGFSISGLSTYIQIPELDTCFDMGECPLSAIGINHVFLSHAHGDHSRCLMRHDSLRRMMGVARPAVYYLPAPLLEGAQEWIRAEVAFEGVREKRILMPRLVPLTPGTPLSLEYRQDLQVESFPVRHSILSMGFTINSVRQKLLDELQGADRETIIARKKSGLPVTRTVLAPKVTYIGDCTGDSLTEQDHIWRSEVLLLEATFLDDSEEEMARKKGHTHIREIARYLESHADTVQCRHIVLKHFSMKYSRKHILRRIAEVIPPDFQERILLLV